MKRAQCSHENARGTRCRMSASDAPSITTCARHTAGYVAKPRTAKLDASNAAHDHEAACGDCGACSLCDAVLAYEDDALAVRESPEGIPNDASRDEFASRPDPNAGTGGRVEQQNIAAGDADSERDGVERHALPTPKRSRKASPPEAMHGAEVTDARAACGDVHDEFTLCPTCDAPRTESLAAVSPALARFLQTDWRGLADVVRESERGDVDVLCVDAPYSAETHAGHGTMERHGTATPPSYDGAARREIDYDAWDDAEVAAFVEVWAPLTRGWFLSLTDDVLAPAWKRALRAQNRWVGTLIPCTERGGTVRLCGGGPSSCTTFLVVARPRTPAWLNWITTESHYVVSREKKPIIGGKPLALMGKILTDYSRPGDLVCDPCAGGAATLRMAVRLGRRAIGAEPMAEHFEIAEPLLAAEVAERAPDVMAMRKQTTLFARTA